MHECVQGRCSRHRAGDAALAAAHRKSDSELSLSITRFLAKLFRGSYHPWASHNIRGERNALGRKCVHNALGVCVLSITISLFWSVVAFVLLLLARRHSKFSNLYIPQTSQTVLAVHAPPARWAPARRKHE